MKFYSFDIDLDPGTLLLKLDLDIAHVYTFGSSTVIVQTDTQRQTDTRSDLLKSFIVKGIFGYLLHRIGLIRGFPRWECQP